MVAHVPMKANGTKVLKGPERVATLLFAMGKPAASRILKHFSEEEIRLVTKSAAQLGPVSPTQIEQLVEEFASNFTDGADLVLRREGHDTAAAAVAEQSHAAHAEHEAHC
jgi:flagellar motor switch protein FliG